MNTHIINLFYEGGGDVSIPAMFSSDEEAIEAAVKEAKSQSDVIGIIVKKYLELNDDGWTTDLKTIFKKGKTY